MKTTANGRVRAAEHELAQAETNLRHTLHPWRTTLRQHRVAALMLGGFTAGLALTLLPTRWWGRIGAAVGTLGAAAARSFLSPAVLGAALARRSERSASERVH